MAQEVCVPTHGLLWKAIDFGSLRNITDLTLDDVWLYIRRQLNYTEAPCDEKGKSAPEEVLHVAEAAKVAAKEAVEAAKGRGASTHEGMEKAITAAMAKLLEPALAYWGCGGDRQPMAILEL